MSDLPSKQVSGAALPVLIGIIAIVLVLCACGLIYHGHGFLAFCLVNMVIGMLYAMPTTKED